MNPHKFFVGRAVGFLIVIVIVVTAYFIYTSLPHAPEEESNGEQASTVYTDDYKSIAYTIEGKEVLLTDGYAEVETAPGSASKTVTKYFGNEAMGDLNGDGSPDVAFLLTQDGGGSGTFYYVVVALRKGAGYVGTNAVLLGDRIAPQTTEIHDGVLVVNYADRGPDEPMTAKPTIGVSSYLHVEGGILSENRN